MHIIESSLYMIRCKMFPAAFLFHLPICSFNVFLAYLHHLGLAFWFPVTSSSSWPQRAPTVKLKAMATFYYYCGNDCCGFQIVFVPYELTGCKKICTE